MELKQRFCQSSLSSSDVLIVPYGIETGNIWLANSEFACVLIVPYGIETKVGKHIIIALAGINCTLWN